MDQTYDSRNCQSLFGYAAAVHARSGGVCQLCGCGGGAELSFDMWRQLTVEHLLGESQGGYRKAISVAVEARFPELSPAARAELTKELDALNTVTACSFCNATTRRYQYRESMGDFIRKTPGDPRAVVAAVAVETKVVLKIKRDEVTRKLLAVRAAFEREVAPVLEQQRAALAVEQDA